MPAGWSTDADGVPVYNGFGMDGEVVFTGYSSLLRVCDETTFITISGTPNDLTKYADLFQKTTSAQLTSGGEIMKSDEKNGSWNIFAYTVFGAGEAEDSDNDGALKTVFVFDTPLDAN